MLREVDEILLSPKYMEQRAYWVKKLAPGVEKTKLPFISGKNRNSEKRIENMEILIPIELFTRLMKLAKRSDLSLHIILLTALKVLIYQYSNNEDVIVVSPVYKKNVTAETLNDRVFIRDSIDGELTFIESLLKIRKSVLEAYENQDYPSAKIIEFLFNTPQVKAVPLDPISDIWCLLLNIHDSKAIEPVQESLIFSFERKENDLKGHILYDGNVYERGYIRLISEHFVTILENSTGDIKTKLSGISFSLREGEKQFLVDFNRTRAGYPKEKTLVELFEEQVEKTPGNLAAVYKERRLTYRELNEKANWFGWRLRAKNVKTGSIVGLMMERSLEMLIALLGVLKAGGAFLPIDEEYPGVRKQLILNDSRAGVLITQKHIYQREKITMQRFAPGEIVCADDEEDDAGEVVNLEVVRNLTDPAYVIYTSGTGGKPKGVVISHQAIVNYTWWAVQQYVKNEAVNFPLYTSISFDLTMTSIFTPLITGNTIVVYGEGEKAVLVRQVIEEDKVGVVKLTPSHLKLIRYIEGQIAPEKIKRFIVGGEELERKLALEITRKYNSKIEIYNEYGPTEAAVGCMICRFDPAKDSGNSVPLGKPAANTQIYILDNRLKPVTPGVPGELCIGGDGLAAGYLNRPELTAEKFLSVSSRSYISKRIYKTGDLARWLLDGNIEFLGRRDKQVKISGFRIELAEIERLLTKHERIKEALVTAGKERKGIGTAEGMGGKYLCAYIVSDNELEIFELREYLLKHLPSYMIPSYFVHLEEIPLTINGKVDTKALPPPGLKVGAEYAAPRNLLEESIVGIWSEVLGVEKGLIGIDANFFEMGGNSLKATILMAKMHKSFHVKIPLVEVFRIPTIRDLAQYIKEAERDIYSEIELGEKKDYYVLSSAQKRLYILQQMKLKSTAYNVPEAVPLPEDIDERKLTGLLTKLIERHEGFRTSFHVVNDVPVQKVHDEVEFEIEYYDPYRAQVEVVVKFVRPFDLSRAPLLRVGLVRKEIEKNLLLVDMHHIISDGVSNDILVRDFMALYNGETLSPLRLQYRDFAQWQDTPVRKERLNAEEKYWLKEFKGMVPLLNMPTDYTRSAEHCFEGSALSFKIDPALTRRVKELALQSEVTLLMFLIAIYKILLSKYTGQEDIVVGTVIAGRRHEDLQNIIGFFVNMLALKTRPNENKTFLGFLREVKEKAIQAYENQDYPFEELVSKLQIQREPGRHPLIDTVFVLQDAGETGTTRQEADVEKESRNPNPLKITHFDLMLHATVTMDSINMVFEYSTTLFKMKTIERISKFYLEILKQVVENRNISLGDIKSSRELVPVESTVLRDSNLEFDF